MVFLLLLCSIAWVAVAIPVGTLAAREIAAGEVVLARKSLTSSPDASASPLKPEKAGDSAAQESRGSAADLSDGSGDPLYRTVVRVVDWAWRIVFCLAVPIGLLLMFFGVEIVQSLMSEGFAENLGGMVFLAVPLTILLCPVLALAQAGEWALRRASRRRLLT